MSSKLLQLYQLLALCTLGMMLTHLKESNAQLGELEDSSQ